MKSVQHDEAVCQLDAYIASSDSGSACRITSHLYAFQKHVSSFVLLKELHVVSSCSAGDDWRGGWSEFIRKQEFLEKRFVGVRLLSSMDDYEVEERKQAAADALMYYSQFAMTCIGQGVQPSKLRLHLLKELSGMPTTLKKEYPQQGSPSTASNATTVDKADHASSSATTVAEPEVDRAANLL